MIVHVSRWGTYHEGSGGWTFIPHCVNLEKPCENCGREVQRGFFCLDGWGWLCQCCGQNAGISIIRCNCGGD